METGEQWSRNREVTISNASILALNSLFETYKSTFRNSQKFSEILPGERFFLPGERFFLPGENQEVLWCNGNSSVVEQFIFFRFSEDIRIFEAFLALDSPGRILIPLMPPPSLFPLILPGESFVFTDSPRRIVCFL